MVHFCLKVSITTKELDRFLSYFYLNSNWWARKKLNLRKENQFKYSKKWFFKSYLSLNWSRSQFIRLLIITFWVYSAEIRKVGWNIRKFLSKNSVLFRVDFDIVENFSGNLWHELTNTRFNYILFSYK